MEIKTDLPLKLYSFQVQDINVIPTNETLKQIFEDHFKEMFSKHDLNQLAENETISAVRKLFKACGMDPSKYRPSSERLLRRVLQSKKWPYINNIVDINNLCSMTSLLPMGAYDLDKIQGEMTARLGNEGEQYESFGKTTNLHGKLILSDTKGAFGSPIADSVRTAVTNNTKNVLVVIFAPVNIYESVFDSVEQLFKELLEK